MSMLSAQCDELRAMAESVGLAMPQAATLMMEAADTITELRETLQRRNKQFEGMTEMWVERRVENAKLRELVRRFTEYVSQDRCEGCVVKSRCRDGEVDECWQLTEIRGLARELGIEVDE